MRAAAQTGRTGRGFSLIELLFVVALLGLLASAAFVSVGTLVPSHRIESSARRLAATVSNLRAEAALRGAPHGLVYDLDRNTFAVLAPPEQDDDAPAEPLALEDLVELEPTPLDRAIAFEDVSFGERKAFRGRVKIFFGTTEPAPPHLVHLKGPDGLRYTVEVNTVTGLVEVFPSYREFDVLLTEEKFHRR